MPYACAPFYDIHSAVGRNAPNSPEDVMLVQYFLFNIMISNSWKVNFEPTAPVTSKGTTGILPHDGKATPLLGDWILEFQRTASQRGLGPLVTDGVVSHGGVAWGKKKSKTTSWRTIHVMNHLLFLADKTRFANLPADASVPQGLKAALGLVTNLDLNMA